MFYTLSNDSVMKLFLIIWYFSERPCIVYGGITEGFVHAEKTEDYLFGK